MRAILVCASLLGQLPFLAAQSPEAPVQPEAAAPQPLRVKVTWRVNADGKFVEIVRHEFTGEPSAADRAAAESYTRFIVSVIPMAPRLKDGQPAPYTAAREFTFPGGQVPTTPVSIGDLDKRPKVVTRPELKQPKALREYPKKLAKDSLRVLATWVVGRDGAVDEVLSIQHELSTPPELRKPMERALLAAFPVMRFEPGLKDGTPVRFHLQQAFEFRVGKGR